jgi:hypothetical protein
VVNRLPGLESDRTSLAHLCPGSNHPGMQKQLDKPAALKVPARVSQHVVDVNW